MTPGKVLFKALTKQSTLKERVAAIAAVLQNIELPNAYSKHEKVAVKIHVGEKKNNTFIAPEIVRQAVRWIKSKGGQPFLTETSTLYKGERSHAINHLIHAFNHGFTYGKVGAPFIMADGLVGNSEIEVAIPGLIYKSVLIAREIETADALVAISHPTGHMVSGLGACIKNLGMGLASRMGKMRQHSSVKPIIKSDLCTLCRLCIKWCPEDAIIERDGKAFIIKENCTGCGECLAVCGFDAVAYNWGVGSADLQKRMAEHALGVIINKKNKCLFINVLADMTEDCDCLAKLQKPIIPDIGILASVDPVAIDQATLDLTRKNDGVDLGRKSYPTLDPTVQLEHAENINLGSRVYELQEIS
ncbi:MAG: DUF362 domain-containing protein [Spirochaetales bacterium]|nr:DUF362 domain-containing protein [Spirochaetales bacterium]